MTEDLLNSLKKEMLSNMLVDVGKIMLTQKEIDVLKKYNINYNSVLTLKELINIIENSLIDEDYPEDLEEIAQSIQERDYYQNTNK